jgi:hypothetical protein
MYRLSESEFRPSQAHATKRLQTASKLACDVPGAPLSLSC